MVVSKSMALLANRNSALRNLFLRSLSTTGRLGPSHEKTGKWPSTGPNQGHPEDPIVWNWDRELPGTTRTIFYRENDVEKYFPWVDNYLTTIFSAILWAWFWYNVYYNGWKLVGGHYHLPRCHEFTDSELGIPPDDGPDPEYWGKQQQ